MTRAAVLWCLAVWLASCGCRPGEPPASAAMGPDDAALAEKLQGRLEEIPDDPGLLESAARLLHHNRRYPEAIDLYRRLLLSQPRRCDVMRLRAQAFLSLDDSEAALDSLRACLRSCPEDLECRFTLGGLLASRHADEIESLGEAIALWERYLETAPDSREAEMVRRVLPRLRQLLEAEAENEKTDKPVNSP